MTKSNQSQTPEIPKATEIIETPSEDRITDRYPLAVAMVIAMVASLVFLTLYLIGLDNNVVFNPFSSMVTVNGYVLGMGEMPAFEAFKAACVLVALPFFLIGLFSFLGVFLAGVFVFVIGVVGFSLLLPSAIFLAPVGLLVLAYVLYKRKKSSPQPVA